MLEHLSFRALQFISHTCPCLACDAFHSQFVVVVKIGVNASSRRFLLALHLPGPRLRSRRGPGAPHRNGDGDDRGIATDSEAEPEPDPVAESDSGAESD